MKVRMTGSSRPPVRGRVLFEGVFQILFVFEDGDGDDMRWPSVLGGQQSVVERASPEPVLLVIHLMMRKAQITLTIPFLFYDNYRATPPPQHSYFC